MIILVKSSDLSSFLLGGRASSSRIESYVRMLTKLMSIESKHKLADSLLCKIYYQMLCRDDEYKGIAACCAVYKRYADWFSSVVGALKLRFPEHSYKELGRLIDVDNPVVDLDELSDTFTRSGSVYAAWISTRAFISGAKTVRSSINLFSFTQSIMLQVLKTASEASDKDGRVMEEILSELDGERRAWKRAFLVAHYF